MTPPGTNGAPRRPSRHYQRGLPFGLGPGDPRGVATQSAAEAEALHALGLAHLHGHGVEQDSSAARRLQREAASLGNADAQFELSLLLALGIGGPRDARAAARWERKAADAGHPRACLNRAARLASARRPDYSAAIRWYERAAAGGNAEAAARLCKMHVVGQGVPPDDAAAERWFQRAAELGYDWAADERDSPS